MPVLGLDPRDPCRAPTPLRRSGSKPWIARSSQAMTKGSGAQRASPLGLVALPLLRAVTHRIGGVLTVLVGDGAPLRSEPRPFDREILEILIDGLVLLVLSRHGDPPREPRPELAVGPAPESEPAFASSPREREPAGLVRPVSRPPASVPLEANPFGPPGTVLDPIPVASSVAPPRSKPGRSSPPALRGASLGSGRSSGTRGPERTSFAISSSTVPFTVPFGGSAARRI